MTQRIFLIGMPGSGKSTLGVQLAKKLGVPFYDLDKIVESQTEKSIGEIFEYEGEDQFRIYERESLNHLIEQSEEFVLACGGGTPCFFDNLFIMNESGKTIYLNTPLATLHRRLKNEINRPLLMSNDLESKLDTLYHSRKEFYNQAQLVVSGDPINVDEITAQLAT